MFDTERSDIDPAGERSYRLNIIPAALAFDSAGLRKQALV
jgi:hypothetical protein